MSEPRILVQLDGDPQASVFDGVVAVDSGVDHLFRHGGVTPEQVRDLVYGALFTRSPDSLRNTAVFVGGSDVTAGETLLQQVTECFFGPMRVSVMLDASGANTTAAAAVIAAGRHLCLKDATVLVMAATGSVGERAAQLLAAEGATVRLGSRSRERAERVCAKIRGKLEGSHLSAHQTLTAEETAAALDGAAAVIAAGAPGIQLISLDQVRHCRTLKVAIDLNAVPPLGIEGIEVTDKAVDRNGVRCYGAVGVGGTKMKIHRAAIEALFSSNDRILDAEEIYEIGRELEA